MKRGWSAVIYMSFKGGGIKNAGPGRLNLPRLGSDGSIGLYTVRLTLEYGTVEPSAVR